MLAVGLVGVFLPGFETKDEEGREEKQEEGWEEEQEEKFRIDTTYYKSIKLY